MNFFISKENDANTILYNVLKNLFIKYVPKENFNLGQNSEEHLKNTVKLFAEKIKSIHQKNLEKFLVDASENIGINIDKIQYNVICQNGGVVINNIKDHDQYTKEGKDELKKKLITFLFLCNEKFCKKINEKNLHRNLKYCLKKVLLLLLIMKKKLMI